MEVKDKIEHAEAVDQLNKDILKARKGKAPGNRLGLIVHENGGVMVVDVTNIELFYGDIVTMNIQARMQTLIDSPFQVELHNIIRGFLDNNLDEII